MHEAGETAGCGVETDGGFWEAEGGGWGGEDEIALVL